MAEKNQQIYFAVEILKLCDGIKGHYSIVNQLERSATSVCQYCRYNKTNTIPKHFS